MERPVEPEEPMNESPIDAAVPNQPPPLADHDPLATDPALASVLELEGAGGALAEVGAFARRVATARVEELARSANRHLPELRTHDRFGRRIDLVEYHPAYHELMALAFGAGVHSRAWIDGEPGAHVVRAALSYLWNQTENGTACPTGMAYASLPTIRKEPRLAAAWTARIVARDYDPRPIPVAEKSAATIGMTLTEKQAGSDLRAVATRAEPLGARGPGEPHRLFGDKWFCSAPMSDGFFTIARTDRGPSFFFLPRILPDGRRNPFRLLRLKDKCGNRSNASAEVELDGTIAWMIGEEGRGVRTAIESAHFTRLDFAIGSAGLVRRALAEAIHHARHRSAFRRPLAELPLMENVLADLALESEAMMRLAFRAAGALDRAGRDERSRRLARIAIPIAKHWNCKRAVVVVAEALEAIGGNGYVEEGPLARLHRESPLNGIWEGAGNPVALDVLRAVGREPETLEALLAELDATKGADAALDAARREIADRFARGGELEAEARRLVERMATALAASLLVRSAPGEVADAFLASRLRGDGGRIFGTLPPSAARRAIAARAFAA